MSGRQYHGAGTVLRLSQVSSAHTPACVPYHYAGQGEGEGVVFIPPLWFLPPPSLTCLISRSIRGECYRGGGSGSLFLAAGVGQPGLAILASLHL